MSLTIKQITPVFAGEVSGVDITKPLSRADAAAIADEIGRAHV